MFGLSKQERREKQLQHDAERYGVGIAMFGDLTLREKDGNYTVNGLPIKNSTANLGSDATFDGHSVMGMTSLQSMIASTPEARTTVSIVWDDGHVITGNLLFVGPDAPSRQSGFDRQAANFITTHNSCVAK